MQAALLDRASAAGLAALEGLARAEAARFAAEACQLAELVELARRACGADGLERFLELDVAGTLRIGQLAASRRMAEATR